MTEDSNYAHTPLHLDMIQDTVRTMSYSMAVDLNSNYFKDKIVVDVGSGTGILSLFAASAGAKKVYAIETTKIADLSQQIIKDNKFENVISLIRGNAEEIDLPEKVDIIISEWMGYSLYYERMLPAVLSIRDRFLKEEGYILPSAAHLYIAPIEAIEFRATTINYWDFLYGYNFEAMKKMAISEPSVRSIHPDQLLDQPALISAIDMHTCTEGDQFFENTFSFTAAKHSSFDCMALWFNAYFNDMPNRITLFTGPKHQSTHWEQTLLRLPEDESVSPGDKIDGILAFKPHPTSKCGLIIELSLIIRGTKAIRQTYNFP